MPKFECQKLFFQSKRLLDVAGKKRVLGGSRETFPVSRRAASKNDGAIVDRLVIRQECALVRVIQPTHGIDDEMQSVRCSSFLQGDAQFLKATTLRRQIYEPGPVDQFWHRIHDGDRCISNQLPQVNSGL